MDEQWQKAEEMDDDLRGESFPGHLHQSHILGRMANEGRAGRKALHQLAGSMSRKKMEALCSTLESAPHENEGLAAMGVLRYKASGASALETNFEDRHEKKATSSSSVSSRAIQGMVCELTGGSKTTVKKEEPGKDALKLVLKEALKTEEKATKEMNNTFTLKRKLRSNEEALRTLGSAENVFRLQCDEFADMHAHADQTPRNTPDEDKKAIADDLRTAIANAKIHLDAFKATKNSLKP